MLRKRVQCEGCVPVCVNTKVDRVQHHSAPLVTNAVVVAASFSGRSGGPVTFRLWIDGEASEIWGYATDSTSMIVSNKQHT